jgi:cell wall-associated NlpC family hydrolase
MVAKSAQPAVKTSAVLAASGGLVASFALPAQAVPSDKPAAQASPQAAPVAVKAPETAAPASTDSFGLIGFKATPKPKPKPRPVVVEQPVQQERAPEQASRSTDRAPLPATKPATGSVLDIAASLAGTPYRYGGTSPETGFDCSGFTQYVFRQVGISLPRTAEQQRQFVTPVSDPQPGDLVFFGSPAGHMGIYAGDGKMWDAPHSGEVVQLRDIYSSNVTYGRP